MLQTFNQIENRFHNTFQDRLKRIEKEKKTTKSTVVFHQKSILSKIVKKWKISNQIQIKTATRSRMKS